MKAARRGTSLFLLALAVVCVDQVIQAWALDVLQPSEARMPGLFCHPLLRFDPDLAWGLFVLPAPWATPGAVGLGIAAAAALAGLMFRGEGATAFAMALLLGGVMNGAVDRLRYGAVVDFLVCQGGGGGWAPTFNAGDLAAFAGALLLLGRGLPLAIRRCRINVAHISRDDQGTV